MHAKYTFTLESRESRRALPRKIIVGQVETETVTHVVLKLLGFVLFYRDRLQLEPRSEDDNIPFSADLLQLDYELRPKLWVECGECSIAKLAKLAVKAPEAEIWVVKPSQNAATDLVGVMTKNDLRRGRYGIVGFDREMIEEIAGLLQPRNTLLWLSGTFEPPRLQFDFNGLWFDSNFTVLRF